jgi:hypothetical protein
MSLYVRVSSRLLLISFLSLASQSAPCQTATGSTSTTPKPPDLFSCYAHEKNAPPTFSSFWDPKALNSPDKQPIVTIGFNDDKSKFPYDCVGDPLQITVPNGQIVQIVAENWMNKCVPTATLNRAVPDSVVADLLALAGKIGAFGVAPTEGPYQQPHFALPAFRNKVLSLTVVCSIASIKGDASKGDADGGDASGGDANLHKLTQTVTITYQNPPRVAVSAGILVSTEGVKSYTILTTKTGVNSSGVATTQNSIGLSGDSSAQVVPFGFANLYLAGTRKLNLSAQFGVGVNPNLSTAKVEFFAAPVALAWHDFYIAPGIHFGQHENLTGGFALGDVVTGLSKAPIGWHYNTGFAVSLSYNLQPLVKPSSSASAKK